MVAFSAYQSKFIPIPMDNKGMITDILQKTLTTFKRHQLAFIYVVPTFQNPTGITMSIERRQMLLELATRYDLPILEDDAYYDLRYSGTPVKSIKSMDRDSKVIYTQTFSKILAPGFRLGYVIGDREIIRKMTIAKQSIDVSTNVFVQYIAAEYITSGLIDKQLEKIKVMYKRKRDIMISALTNHFPEKCSWTLPNGGMFIWVTLPSNIDTKQLFFEAIKQKVAFVHGAAFHVTQEKQSTMRLNFTNTDDDKIEIGIKRLSTILNKKR
ncbi:MAG: PLP-dependent aminotransferase family protein [Candidatus Bathyarchaeota archaeon]|nr:MAG: PLP-dependent aminotransferase family protein [Candidatus Bathyarchaeota archaeon]